MVHDGALARFSFSVQDVLGNTYYDWWIDRRDPLHVLSVRHTRIFCYYLWGHLNMHMYSAPVNDEEALHHHIVDACQTVWNCPDIFDWMQQSIKRCVEPCINFMEDILNTYYKCTLSAIKYKLNVSRHMLIWIFFYCFDMWNYSQTLSAPFIYTL
jgi:hypothetical protein